MASSGSFLTNGWYSSGKGDYVYLEFAWSVTSTSIENNQKTIYWELRCKRTASGYVTSGPFEVTIDGKVYSYNTRKDLYNGTIVASGYETFKHNDKGERSFKASVRGGVYYSDINTCTGEKTFELDSIPRASTITSAASVTLGNKCDIRWTPLSSSFRYKLEFTLGNWKDTSWVIRPNTTSPYTYSGYTIPLEVAKQITNGYTGKMKVNLYTYSDDAATNQIGSADPEEFTVTVPKTAGPNVLMDLTPVHTLPEVFDGLYIQGLSKVKATITGKTQYDAKVKSCDITVDNRKYGADDDYTSAYLTKAGEVVVKGHVVDSRTYDATSDIPITVLPYANPKILNATAKRCDQNGNISDNGTYLKITATRSYQPVISDGVQKNFCEIRYRYKAESDSYYSEWIPLLNADDLSTDDVVTEPLLNGSLLATTSYRVEIQAIDDTDNVSPPSTILIPTEKVYWHRDGARNALGLGKYNERDNAIDSDWDFYMNNHKVTGLQTPVEDTDAVPLGFLQDYIVEQKTDGIWTYRKWNSGIAECWGRATTHSVADWSNTQAVCTVTLPFTFAELPIVASSGGQVGLAGSYITYTESTTTKIISYMKCSAEPTAGSYCWFDFQVKGRWIKE